MDKKTLIEKLVQHYAACINGVRKLNNMADISQYLSNNYIGRGACYCADQVFGDSSMYFDQWTKAYWNDKGDAGYWGKCPDEYQSKRGVLMALRVRFDILQKELTK